MNKEHHCKCPFDIISHMKLCGPIITTMISKNLIENLNSINMVQTIYELLWFRNNTKNIKLRMLNANVCHHSVLLQLYAYWRLSVHNQIFPLAFMTTIAKVNESSVIKTRIQCMTQIYGTKNFNKNICCAWSIVYLHVLCKFYDVCTELTYTTSKRC